MAWCHKAASLMAPSHYLSQYCPRSISPYVVTRSQWVIRQVRSSHSGVTSSPAGGGVLPMWWVIHMCRGFDPLFSLWQDRARSFWGYFSHPPTAKLSFGVQKLPIFTKIDLFGPKFNFFLDLFGSNFQRPAAHPHQFSGRVPPPPGIFLVCPFKLILEHWPQHWSEWSIDNQSPVSFPRQPPT